MNDFKTAIRTDCQNLTRFIGQTIVAAIVSLVEHPVLNLLRLATLIGLAWCGYLLANELTNGKL